MLCGSPKQQPRTSSIVQFILFVWYFEIGGNILRNFYMFRPMYSKQAFVILTPFGLILIFLLDALLSIITLAFIASSLRVTEEHLFFETVQSGPYSSFECFSLLLKELTFIFYLAPCKDSNQPGHIPGHTCMPSLTRLRCALNQLPIMITCP